MVDRFAPNFFLLLIKRNKKEVPGKLFIFAKKMQLALRELWAYAEAHSTEEQQVLKDLIRETHLTRMMPQMLCGRIIGNLLGLLSTLQRPRVIVEIGTFTGYSTIQLAKGLGADGELHTYELNEEMDDIHQQFFERAGIADRVKVYYGSALDLLGDLHVGVDLVFIDADKRQYPDYYKLIAPKLNEGALLIADNVLWDGKVIEEEANDPETLGVRRFNELVAQDEAMEKVLLPMMDGIMLARKC